MCLRHMAQLPHWDGKMKYEDAQTVVLGDIVTVDLHDGDHTGRTIMCFMLDFRSGRLWKAALLYNSG